MTITMTTKTIWILLTIVVPLHGQNAFWDTDLYNKMENALENLCPGVDICNRNASEPNVLPNGFINTKSYTSCCQGCSCHKNCHDHLNCCFLDDTGTNGGSDEAMDKTKECVYMQTDTPDETPSERAYITVTKAPRGGCKPPSPSQTTKNLQINASCSKKPIAPWGDLFPVYSIERDTIYKNEQCALCHGVVDTIPWQPLLICDSEEAESSRTIPLSEQLQFLETGTNSANCYVAFEYKDRSVLYGKRCYNNPVYTCKHTSDLNFNKSPKFPLLTANDITEACHSGLHSIVSFEKTVYKNIFCAMCNANIPAHPLTCSVNDHRIVPTSKISLLIDSKVLQKKSPERTTERRLVCLQNGTTMDTGSCRDTICPSGQIRIRGGNCLFPSTKWNKELFLLTVKLTYTDSSLNILTLYEQEHISKVDIENSFLKTTPWPAHWAIAILRHSSGTDESRHGKNIIVTLASEINIPQKLIRDIRNSLSRPWTVVINGSVVTFEQQSILEYSLVKDKLELQISKPRWEVKADQMGLQTNLTGTVPQKWVFVIKERITIKPNPLTKLFICDQIGLRPDEYQLMIENDVLKSNLTKRILFDSEFELVKDGNETTTARVCLSDTIFHTWVVTNSSYKRTYSVCAISIVWCIFVLK